MRAAAQFSICVVLCGALNITFSAAALTEFPGPQLLVLTNIARIKQLKESEATRGYPVRVRGVVTFQNGVRDAVIHDLTDGIFVARGNASFDLQQGQLVEVRGVTGFAGYAPRIDAERIEVLGTASLPSPRRLTRIPTRAGT